MSRLYLSSNKCSSQRPPRLGVRGHLERVKQAKRGSDTKQLLDVSTTSPLDGKSCIFVFERKYSYEIPFLTENPKNAGVGMYSNMLYVIGGSTEGETTNQVYAFDLMQRTDLQVNPGWRRAEPMIYRRENHAVASYSDSLMWVSGGWNDADGLMSTCEEHSVTPQGIMSGNSNSRAWRRLKSLLTPRCDHSMVYSKGRLYVLGGYVKDNHDQFIVTNSVEKFKFKTKQWKSFPPMLVKRTLFSAVVHKDKIIAVGGYEGDLDGNHVMHDSVEMCDLSISKKERNWTIITKMPEPRCGFVANVCKHENMIYIFGGWTSVGVDEIEFAENCYFLKMDGGDLEWKDIEEKNLPKRRMFFVNYSPKKRGGFKKEESFLREFGRRQSLGFQRNSSSGVFSIDATSCGATSSRASAIEPLQSEL